jgi:5-oxopent-3-ene-1,2,5-tricarboxylate decarboxylase/2-hydroxyhepta-2,4-diene-1,7-dioate isomerase
MQRGEISMFAPVVDQVLHLEGEPLARDVDAHTAATLLGEGRKCRPPVNGTVYGTLLNDHATLSALGDAVNEPPYKAPPKAPVLYVKPRNTFAGHRASVRIPDSIDCVAVGGSLGIVIGRTATRVNAADALDFVAGYTVVADLYVPHASVYRPSVRYRARDGFCVIGPTLVARRYVGDADSLEIQISVEGKDRFVASTSSAIRSVATLIADVTDFMTLSPGDVLTLGVPHGVPNARVGDRVTVKIGDWAPLEFSVAQEEKAGGQA